MRRKERCSKGGSVAKTERLGNALNYKPITSIVVFEINTHNPRTGAKHNLVIRHEINNGNNRFNVYLDGVKWQKQFSRFGFCRWLFKKIDSVIFC